ncbi:6-phosphogluconolactonase [Pseudomonadales bacterium]|nr:6-phosphogluconolactonase [Pseudomonadales bacterium]
MKKNIFATHDALASELATAVAERLSRAIEKKGHASVAFSGGSTPKLFFSKLAEHSLNWAAVHVTLVDERCVDFDNERSNARLLHQNLLSKLSTQPVFHTLYKGEESVAQLNERLAELPLPFDCVVLGMGDDGHTASFFPNAGNLPTLLDLSQQQGLFGTEDGPDGEQRLTWSLAALLQAEYLVLHICGERKWEVLQDAMAPFNDNVESAELLLPVSVLLSQTTQVKLNGTPLDIYFAKNC